MPNARRGRPRDARIDEAIVDSGVEELADAGFASFCVESVAERAGVSKATVYRRFPSRSALIQAVLEVAAADAAEPDAGMNARDRLAAVLEGIRERTPHSATFRIMRHASAELGSNGPEAEAVSTILIEPRRERVRACIRDGIATGEFRADADIDAMVALLVGAVVHLETWSRAPADNAGPQLTVRELIDLATQGIGA